MAYRSFEDLDVWQRACELAVFVDRCTRETREYGLGDQMRRAAVSIPSKIAEGSERSKKDFARFLAIAEGSSSEFRTQAFIAARVEVISKADAGHLVEESKQLGRMMHALSKSLVPENFNLNPQN